MACYHPLFKQNLSRMMNECCGTISRQKFFRPESPQHTDAGHTAVASRCHVNITVADIHGTVFRNAQLPQCLDNGIRCRLFPNIFALSDSHLYIIMKEMSAQLLRSIIKFVADNCKVFALFCSSASNSIIPGYGLVVSRLCTR